MLYPGISAELIDNQLKQPVKAMIMQSYGVDAIAPQDKRLLNSFKRGIEQGITIVNCASAFVAALTWAVMPPAMRWRSWVWSRDPT